MGKVHNLIRKGKNLYAKLVKVYSKNTSSTHEIMKKENEIYASFGVTS